MNKEHSILIQKTKGGGAVKDLYDDFGIVCTNIPMLSSNEAKDVVSRSWPDEDGEDAYLPERIALKAGDWKISMACRGSNTYGTVESFVSWLCGRTDAGTRLKLYSSRYGMGFKDCYFKSIGEFDFSKDSNGVELLEFGVTFHVCDPVTKIVPAMNGSIIQSLTEQQ